ncbi:MAG TPA: nucleotidyltransferase family protein [Patescibacteria group bacterium]|nr:nucleotidyltransferase family protein [Patescibacteria group bacterium]
MDAIILAGGRSSRMEGALPKILVEVKDNPLISYQINYLSDKVERIILALGYKAGDIVNYVQAKYPQYQIDFSVENSQLGTGGAIKKAMKMVKSDRVLVLNCDDLTDIDVAKLEGEKDNIICVAHPQLPFGLVKDEKGYAVFEEKPTLEDWVSCGWYVFNRNDMIDVLPDVGSIEYDVFPKIKLKLHKHEGYWRSFNTKKDVDAMEKEEMPDVFKEKEERV